MIEKRQGWETRLVAELLFSVAVHEQWINESRTRRDIPEIFQTLVGVPNDAQVASKQAFWCFKFNPFPLSIGMTV